MAWLETNGPATIRQIKAAGFASIPQLKMLREKGAIESFEGFNDAGEGEHYGRAVATFYKVGKTKYEPPTLPEGTSRHSKKAVRSLDISGFDSLPNAAMVDVKVVAALIDCNVSTVWTKAKHDGFPQPRKIGGSTRWNVGELRAYLTGK
jgi:predicted DNA-binding transcriptional regulator AlpA